MKNNKIALGTYNLPSPKTEIAIRTAFESGYDFIDTAKVYGTESAIGQALMKLGLQDRFKVQTKIWNTDYKDPRSAFEKQLKDLQLKKVWSLLLHRPSINFEECILAWKVLIELQKEGKVEHIGVSNFERDHLYLLKNQTGVLPEFNQIELSVDNFRWDRVAVAKNLDIKIQSWSPMGTMALTNSKVIEIANKHKVPASSILIAYLANQDLCPIVKSADAKHIKDNIAALSIKLSPIEMETLHKINTYSPKFSEMFPNEYF